MSKILAYILSASLIIKLSLDWVTLVLILLLAGILILYCKNKGKFLSKLYWYVNISIWVLFAIAFVKYSFYSETFTQNVSVHKIEYFKTESRHGGETHYYNMYFSLEVDGKFRYYSCPHIKSIATGDNVKVRYKMFGRSPRILECLEEA